MSDKYISTGVSGGGTGTPGGTTGQIQTNAGGGNFGGITVSGDGTLNGTTGALVVTATNGAAFAASATTDTTNAANISSGTLLAARMPALTGDITTVAGAVATTLATVNANVGSFTNTNLTVNAKGQITAASNGSGGGVSSITGDGIVINNSGSTGAVTLTQANAAAYTTLANATGSSAAPTYAFGMLGFQTLTVNTTLTSTSPAFNQVLAGTQRTITLPVASTCIGKPIYVYNNGTVAHTVAAQGSDTIGIHNNTAASVVLANGGGILLYASATNVWSTALFSPIDSGISGFVPIAGGLIYGVSSLSASIAASAAGTSGQVTLSGGTGSPTFTPALTVGTSVVSVVSRGLVLPRATVADVDRTQLATDYLIAYTTLTAPRTVTLITSGITAGQQLIIKDETGNAGTQNITVSGVNIDGAASKVINANYGVLRLYFNGTVYFTL